MDKLRCDACGKEVGAASMWRRMGFLPGSTLNLVCTSCYHGKLRRDDRLRFAKAAGPRKAARAGAGGGSSGEAEEAADPHRAPDELRFGG